ncbi:DnaB-like helicase C-terminal domain-containing protein [Streptomyces lydicus]|uniref:DnaB-like helicase C-terminal domain-containing protein n=1 Tax=Streptomyces lydicus TaxID=47763 RepID=UPI0037F32687
MTETEALSLEEALDRAINRAAADQPDLPRGVSTGFTDLDSLTGGLRPGTLTVLASRPAVGRSTLLLNICRNAAIPAPRRTGPHIPVLHISLEDGTSETVQRIMSAESRVALHHLRSGTLTSEDVTRLERRMPTVANAPLYLWDPPRVTAAQIATKATRYIEDNDVQLIAIDGIQDIRPEKRNDLREREVGDVVRDLKALARELDVPVVATSHLNRAPEQRHDRVPMLDDLRESGAITFAADTILLLHRPDAYERDTPRAGEADFLVVKHRQGPTATITVAFQGHYSRFVDMAQT